MGYVSMIKGFASELAVSAALRRSPT